MKSSTDKGFRIDFSPNNQYENKSRYSIGVVTSPNYKFVASYDSGGTANEQHSSTYTANTDVTCKFHRENGNLIASIDDFSYTFTDISNLRYIGIVNWNNAKTVTITDLKVKPL